MKVEIETFKEELSKKIYGEDNKSVIILIQVNDGVTVDGEKVTSIDSTFARDMFIDGLVVKKGKKSFRKVAVK